MFFFILGHIFIYLRTPLNKANILNWLSEWSHPEMTMHCTSFNITPESNESVYLLSHNLRLVK